MLQEGIGCHGSPNVDPLNAAVVQCTWLGVREGALNSQWGYEKLIYHLHLYTTGIIVVEMWPQGLHLALSHAVS